MIYLCCGGITELPTEGEENQNVDRVAVLEGGQDEGVEPS